MEKTEAIDCGVGNTESAEMSASIIDSEIEALKSIFIDELKVTKSENGGLIVLILNLEPATANVKEDSFVCLTLHITVSENYPDDEPILVISNPRGLSEEGLKRIMTDTKVKSEQMLGNPMLFELIDVAKEYLTLWNMPSCQCAICLNEFSQEDVFTKTECYHYFHSHCLAQFVKYAKEQFEEEQSKGIEQSGIVPQNFKTECPVCRLAIKFECSKNYPAPSAGTSVDEPFELSDEIKKIQEKLSSVYETQKSRGGIIDLEEEKNKYLLEISSVPTRIVTLPVTIEAAEEITTKEQPKRRLPQKNAEYLKNKALLKTLESDSVGNKKAHEANEDLINSVENEEIPSTENGYEGKSQSPSHNPKKSSLQETNHKEELDRRVNKPNYSRHSNSDYDNKGRYGRYNSNNDYYRQPRNNYNQPRGNYNQPRGRYNKQNVNYNRNYNQQNNNRRDWYGNWNRDDRSNYNRYPNRDYNDYYNKPRSSFNNTDKDEDLQKNDLNSSKSTTRYNERDSKTHSNKLLVVSDGLEDPNGACGGDVIIKSVENSTEKENVKEVERFNKPRRNGSYQDKRFKQNTRRFRENSEKTGENEFINNSEKEPINDPSDSNSKTQDKEASSNNDEKVVRAAPNRRNRYNSRNNSEREEYPVYANLQNSSPETSVKVTVNISQSEVTTRKSGRYNKKSTQKPQSGSLISRLDNDHNDFINEYKDDIPGNCDKFISSKYSDKARPKSNRPPYRKPRNQSDSNSGTKQPISNDFEANDTNVENKTAKEGEDQKKTENEVGEDQKKTENQINEDQKKTENLIGENSRDRNSHYNMKRNQRSSYKNPSKQQFGRQNSNRDGKSGNYDYDRSEYNRNYASNDYGVPNYNAANHYRPRSYRGSSGRAEHNFQSSRFHSDKPRYKGGNPSYMQESNTPKIRHPEAEFHPPGIPVLKRHHTNELPVNGEHDN